MAGTVSKFVFKRILKETVENKQGRSDPYFEYVPTKKLSTFSGKPKMKRQKRALPPGLSEEDQQVLVKVKRRAYRLDMALGSFMGLKIGWGSVIGIVPGLGDVADTLLALMVVRTASEAGLPLGVKIRMLFNILFDFVIGLIPFLGDLIDMAYKANTRNAIILEDYLRTRGTDNIRRQGLPKQEDPSLGEVEALNESGVVSTSDSGHQVHQSRGWTGGTKQPDLEAQTRNSREPKASKPKPAKGRNGSSRGHVRLFSQETGTVG